MKGKSLIRNSFAVLGIAVGLILISAIPAHATIINRDYEPTFDYQYGEHVNESLGYTATQTVTSHPIGASDLNFGASSNYDLEITGTAQPVGKYELDISSSSIQVFDPAVMLYLNIKIKANVYLPYTIRYVDGSGNLLLTDSGKLYQDNKWENAKLEFIATSSDAGQKYRVKDTQAYSSAQFAAGTPPKVFISTTFAQGATAKTVIYTLLCEKVLTPSGGGTGGTGSGSGGGTGGTSGTGSGTGGIGSGSGGSGSGIGGGKGSGTGGGSGSGSGGGSGSGSGGGSGSSTGGGSNGYGGGKAVLSKSGWIYDNKEDEWYYYSGRTRNTLKKGWHYDNYDKKWYYLDLDSGKMFKGWHLISGKWYFFTPQTSEKTWELGSDGEWYYLNNTNIRPLGSMYRNEVTPDGYRVNEDGQY